VSKWVDEGYVNRLTVEQARSELLIALENQFALIEALKTAPEMADPLVLHLLGSAAAYEDNDLGKRLQRKLGLGSIPPVSECESGAGLWWRILQGLKTERPSALPE
jgi:hypothetical protein